MKQFGVISAAVGSGLAMSRSDHLVGADDKRLRKSDTECFRCLEIKHHLEFSRLLKGRKAEAGSVPRISASVIEAAVLKAVQTKLDCNGLTPIQCADKFVRRVVMHAKDFAITLNSDGHIEASNAKVPFINQSHGNRAEIDESGTNHSERTANPLLVQAIVRARNWLKFLSDGTCSSIEDLARRLDLHPKVIRKGLRLAFLSPMITRGVLLGEQRGARSLGELEQSAALSWYEQSETLIRSRLGIGLKSKERNTARQTPNHVPHKS